MTNAEQIAAVYLPAGVNALEAVGFAEAVGLLPGVRVVLVADRAGPVVSDGGGVALQAEAGIDDLDAASALDLGPHVVGRLADAATARAVQVALEYDVDHRGPPFAPRPLPAPTEAEIATLMSLMTAGTRAGIIAELQGAVR